jgi:methylmalonyl-CoA mutase C-terminal domain/subunit
MTTPRRNTGRKVLIAKPGLDGHDVGAKVVAHAFAEAGYEVAYTGLHQTPEAVVEAVAKADADVVGLSILSGAHMVLCARIKQLLDARGMSDRLLLVGGNIPAADRPRLIELGYAAVFPTASRLDDIVAFVKEKLS